MAMTSKGRQAAIVVVVYLRANISYVSVIWGKKVSGCQLLLTE